MTTTNRKLLLVDDDHLFAGLMNDFLTDVGYEVATAYDGVEGLGLARKFGPEVLIADIMMPRMDGFEMVEALRQDVRFQSLPIIFLSAKGETTDRIHGLNAGADAYLVKPFELEELTALLEALIRRVGRATANSQVKNPAIEPMPSAIKHEDLTPTERSVLKYLAVGLLNKEIAKRMILSTRTVESHVHSMLQKTSLSNRTALARWAMEYDLL